MPSDLTILAFDTSAAHCAAALLRGGVPVAGRYDVMERGQGERLVPLLEELLGAAGTAWSDLDAIAVGIGPGNFTGLRISVSAARGFALSLGIPAVGVTGFEWLHEGHDWHGPVMIALPAPRDRAYVQVFGDQRPLTDPVMTTPGRRDPALEHPDLRVVGHRALDIAAPYAARWDARPWDERRPETMAPTLGLIANRKLARSERPWTGRPAPLYIRAPDAVPNTRPPPPTLP